YAESVEQTGGSFFTASVRKLIPYGGFLVTLAVIFSATSALNATIYSATRASFALGRDGMLPPAFARIHSRRKTPFIALGVTAVIVLVASLLLDRHTGAATASMMFLCLFFMVNLCAIRIRVHMGDELEYGFVMPLFPLFPILAIVCQVALAGGIFGESLPAFVVAGVWVPAGALIYWCYSRTRAPAGEHEIQVIEGAPSPKKAGEYRMMVAVANPDNALQMVRTTYRLAQAKSANVQLLHMVPVPPQVPLSDAGKYMMAGREGMVETMLYLAPMFPITTAMRYCRNAARGIVSAVRDHRSDMLVLGWHGKARHHTFKLGSTIDPIIERCPSNVVVMKDCGGNRQFRRVLVPIGGGPNSAFALEIATIMAEAEDGLVTALSVATAHRPAMDLRAFIAQHADRLPLPPSRIQPLVVESEEVTNAILAQATEHDLVVVGCTREPLLRQVTHATLPELIAQRCDKPLVMVKASGGLRSWVKRWI
ncbi:MAG: amino acid permease, partial [Planctomycetota bacterium]